MRSAWRWLATIGLAGIALFVIAACGGGGSGKARARPTTRPSGTATVGGGAATNEGPSTPTSSPGTPTVGVDALTADFSAMAKLKPLASQGKGMIGVLLPDTTTSTRYVQEAAPTRG